MSEYDVRNCEYDVRNCEYDVRNCKCEKLFGIKLKLDNKLNFENHIIDICIEENFRKIYALVRLAPYFCSLFRGVATGGGGGRGVLWYPHITFRIKQGPRVSVSNITNIAFYECSEIIRN